MTKQETMTRPALLSVPAALMMLGGISRTTLETWSRAGRIATVKIGGRRLVPASEIDRLTRGESSCPAAAPGPNSARAPRQETFDGDAA